MNVSETAQRLSCRDPTLKWIDLFNNSDAELAKLADCLVAHPDVVMRLWLGRNQLTDETGIKLARYVAASSTVELLSLSDNQLGEATYLAMAAALRVNSSLQYLYLADNLAVDTERIDASFVRALRFNPSRPDRSQWWLTVMGNEYERLKCTAEEGGAMTMLEHLAIADERDF